MLINCKIDSSYYQIYLAAENTEFDVLSTEEGFSFGSDCVFISTAWEGIDGEITVSMQNVVPSENFFLKGEVEISSPNRIFELSNPDSPGGGIFFESFSPSLKIKIFNDGEKELTQIVLLIENSVLSVIGYSTTDTA